MKPISYCMCIVYGKRASSESSEVFIKNKHPHSTKQIEPYVRIRALWLMSIRIRAYGYFQMLECARPEKRYIIWTIWAAKKSSKLLECTLSIANASHGLHKNIKSWKWRFSWHAEAGSFRWSSCKFFPWSVIHSPSVTSILSIQKRHMESFRNKLDATFHKSAIDILYSIKHYESRHQLHRYWYFTKATNDHQILTSRPKVSSLSHSSPIRQIRESINMSLSSCGPESQWKTNETFSPSTF